MKRLSTHIMAIALVLLSLASCAREGRVIPRSDLTKIYVDMFVADAWLTSQNQQMRKKVDTSAFYEPIFNSYGYTTADYIASEAHYLKDPDRYSRILKKVHEILSEELKQAEDDLAAYSMELSRAAARRSTIDRVFEMYDTLFHSASFTDRVDMQLDTTGRYFPARVLGDTLFLGPKMIVPADTVSVQKDTLAVEGPEEDD